MFAQNNILVTGAAGFIGSHICDYLIQNTEARCVVGFDVLAYCASKDNLCLVADKPNFHFVRGDICNEHDVRKALEVYDIDTIVHCAAESHVCNSFGNSLHFTRVNVLGTHVMLECARARHNSGKLKRFLHISTDEVYGTTALGKSHDESSLLQPTNPYAASKAAAEQLVNSYHESFELPMVITRSNNIYGPRQHPEKVIPRFVQRVLRGKAPLVDGRSGNERTFLYVTDVAAAICMVLDKGVNGETYNIGCDNRIIISDLADMVVQHAHKHYDLSKDIAAKKSGKDRPFNDARYVLEWSKIRELGWQPCVDFDNGLAKVFEWHNVEDLRKFHWNDNEWHAMV